MRMNSKRSRWKISKMASSRKIQSYGLKSYQNPTNYHASPWSSRILTKKLSSWIFIISWRRDRLLNFSKKSSPSESNWASNSPTSKAATAESLLAEMTIQRILYLRTRKRTLPQASKSAETHSSNLASTWRLSTSILLPFRGPVEMLNWVKLYSRTSLNAIFHWSATT